MSAHDLSDAVASVPDPLLGTVVAERYKIVRKLGEGGMGIVYEGEHVLIKRRVAIKTLHAQYARNAEVVLRFQREALAATAIGNEHIIEATDMGRLPDGSVFLVLEYLDGQDLSKLLEKSPMLTLGRTMHIVAQMCEALQAAHDKGIVHRDLKPDNVYLIKRGSDPDFVKVLDFGISKFMDASQSGGSMTRTGAAVGTPYYMSPEQSRGDKNLDHRTDIYSIGVMLFQMLSGRLPFTADNFPGLMIQIALDAPPDLRTLRPDLSAELATLVTRTLSKVREDRPQTCLELGRLLAPFATRGPGEPVTGEIALAATGYVESPIAPQIAPPNAPTQPLPLTEFRESSALAKSAARGPTSIPAGSLAGSLGGSLAGTSSELVPPKSAGRSRLMLGAGIASLIAIAAVIGVVRPWQSREAARTASTSARAQDEVAPDPARSREALGASAATTGLTPTDPAATAAAMNTATTVRVNIDTNPAGARLSLDGLPIANPFHGDVPAGRTIHRIEATLAGHRTIVQEIALAFGQDVHVDLPRGNGVEHRRLDATRTVGADGTHSAGAAPQPSRGAVTPAATTAASPPETRPVAAIYEDPPSAPATPAAVIARPPANPPPSQPSNSGTGTAIVAPPVRDPI